MYFLTYIGYIFFEIEVSIPDTKFVTIYLIYVIVWDLKLTKDRQTL